MKKTLIALALATTAVSGSAMAWTEGSTGGDVEFGGTITKQNPVVWMWKLGAGKIDLNNKATELTDGDKKLTITAATDMPILVGKTREAFSGVDFSGNNSLPAIEFLSAGSKVTPTFSADGGVSLIVKMFDAKNSGTELGALTVNAKAVGTQSMQRSNGTSFWSATVSGGGNPGDVAFSGGLPDSSLVLKSVANANALMQSYGGEPVSGLEAMINAATGNTQPFTTRDQAAGISKSNTNLYTAVAYGIGIPVGNSLEANFTAPITTTTQWKAPITVSISYL